MIRAQLVSTGIWVPGTRVKRPASIPAEQLDILRVAQDLGAPQDTWVPSTRHEANPERLAVDAGVMAGRDALERADLDPQEITHVFSFSLTPDRPGWTDAPGIAHGLGMTGARAIGVDSSAVSILEQAVIADALIQARVAGPVLCVVTNLITRVLPQGHPMRLYVGDVAAAMVLVPGERALVEHVVPAPTSGDLHDVVYFGCPDGRRWWESGSSPMGPMAQPGDKYRDLVDTAALYTVRAIQEIPRWQSCDWFMTPQDRGWMREAVARGLGTDKLGPDIYDRYGAVGPCAPVLSLHHGRKATKRQRIGTYIHGAGLTQWCGILSV